MYNNNNWVKLTWNYIIRLNIKKYVHIALIRSIYACSMRVRETHVLGARTRGIKAV